MKHIIIVGSGPVGSFMAVLCRQLNYPVTVYEKRQEFTRNINLKIDSDLFKEVLDVLSGLGIQSYFFTEFYNNLQRQKGRILIKEMEEMFTEEVKELGAKYVIKEINDFNELLSEQKTSDFLILDCTGRNSRLRSRMLGSDENNIVSEPLQHAMYINFKAIITSVTSLYQVMKNVPGIKLTEVVVSKNKDSDGFTNVTIPVFITKALAKHFHKEHPDINRNPLNPFNSSVAVSDNIFFPISSIIGNLLVDNCYVDLNSVKVKKIVISCGYAKKRSNDYFICLGDSAAHLAFFRSLNVGLKHALELFIRLSMFIKDNTELVNYDDVMQQFKYYNPHLNPIRVYPSEARNVFFVTTKVLWYGCFIFCTTNKKTTRLTDVTGRTEREIYSLMAKHNHKLSQWKESLKYFEAEREKSIQSEISSNKLKNLSFDIASLFIDINGKSIFKISEVLRAVGGKQSLYRQDFNFLLKCFKARREVVIYNTCSEIKEITVVFIIYNLVNQLGENITNVLHKVKRISTNEKFSNEEKIRLIKFTISNKFEKNSKELVLETAEKAIGLWPKLLGLRFDGNEVRLNIVLTLIKNELRACYRNCSESTSIMVSTSNHEDSSESFNQNKLSIAVSEENLLLDDWVLVDSMQNIRESRRYRSETTLTRVCKSIEYAPIYNPMSDIWELKNKIKSKQ